MQTVELIARSVSLEIAQTRNNRDSAKALDDYFARLLRTAPAEPAKETKADAKAKAEAEDKPGAKK